MGWIDFERSNGRLSTQKMIFIIILQYLCRNEPPGIKGLSPAITARVPIDSQVNTGDVGITVEGIPTESISTSWLHLNYLVYTSCYARGKHSGKFSFFSQYL